MINKNQINKILKYENINLFDETSLSTFQNDRETDYINFFKTKTNKIMIIMKIINLLFKVIFLFIKIFSQELIFNPFRNSIALNGNIFICYNRKNLKNNWHEKFKIKKKIINLTSPYPTIFERKIMGNISLKNYIKAINIFILTSFFLFKKQKKILNFLYCLFEILKFEKFFTYIFCFQILDKISPNKLKIFHQYENLPRDKILIKYLNQYKIYSCISTPIMRFDRPNIKFFYKSSILPKNYIFFYEEKFLAFKKNLKKNIKIKIIFNKINKKKLIPEININFLKKNLINKIVILLSDKIFEEKFFLKYLNKKNIFIKFHPSSKNYNKKQIVIDDQTLVISSQYTNDGYFNSLKNKKVVIFRNSDDNNFCYKYINLPVLKKTELKKILNFISNIK